MIEPLTYFWLLLKASLFSTGGTGNLPSLHADLLARGWANEQQFAESLAIGQISPGPSGLWVISLGYLVDGLRGAVLTLIAISLPPLVVLLALALPGVVAGSVFVESVFSWPGMGKTMLTAINARDYPLVMGATVVYAAVVVLANLAADVALPFVDPRRRA